MSNGEKMANLLDQLQLFKLSKFLRVTSGKLKMGLPKSVTK